MGTSILTPARHQMEDEPLSRCFGGPPLPTREKLGGGGSGERARWLRGPADVFFHALVEVPVDIPCQSHAVSLEDTYHDTRLEASPPGLAYVKLA